MAFYRFLFLLKLISAPPLSFFVHKVNNSLFVPKRNETLNLGTLYKVYDFLQNLPTVLLQMQQFLHTTHELDINWVSVVGSVIQATGKVKFEDGLRM